MYQDSFSLQSTKCTGLFGQPEKNRTTEKDRR
uniref:Uncharacterized protein n=1 Tax=Anguilla anguilla TaxID=7936 RepID=A0A0E9VGN6_ANGAN